MENELRAISNLDSALSPLQADKPLPRSRLKMSHLRMIVALEEQEMVSAAAATMNISQPAASRMIAEMESLLDAQLCERLSRGVRLTPLGQSLARHARSVLLQLLQAEQEITDMRTGRSGSVALGSVTAPAIDLAAPAISKIRSIFPKIELNIKIDTSNVLARDLLASRLDFIIARVPDDLDPALFDWLTIGVEEACLIVRGGHPLLAHAPVKLSQLNVYDWVMQPRGTPLRRTIENMFLAKNLSPPERLSNTGPIEILPTQFEIVVQPYSLIKVRNRAMSPAAQSVYDFVRTEAVARGA